MKMVEEEIRLLREISCKLDQLILLLKLSNKEKLEAFRIEIEKDAIFRRILEVADGTLSYSNLVRKVSEDTGTSEITVKRKISSLKDWGLLKARREGKEVYYENSGLLD
mgnify:CR=1 FL=1